MTDRKPRPCPVVISHPGCDVEPMRCGTCRNSIDVALDEVECRLDVGSSPRFDVDNFCRDWHCRKCGGDVRR